MIWREQSFIVVVRSDFDSQLSAILVTRQKDSCITQHDDALVHSLDRKITADGSSIEPAVLNIEEECPIVWGKYNCWGPLDLSSLDDLKVQHFIEFSLLKFTGFWAGALQRRLNKARTSAIN